MRDMPDPRMKPGEVAVKMLRVGLCGTDAEINHGLYGKPPDGGVPHPRPRESRCRRGGKGQRAGRWATGRVDRPAAVRHLGCKAGENDGSSPDTERSIMAPRVHGRNATRVAAVLNKIRGRSRLAVLLEPMSVSKGSTTPSCCSGASSGSRSSRSSSAAVPSGCWRTGAACTALRDRRRPRTGPNQAQIGRSGRISRSPTRRLRRAEGRRWRSSEATGSARVVFAPWRRRAEQGAVLLSVTGGVRRARAGRPDQPAPRHQQRSSSAASAGATAMGVKDFVAIEKKWPGVMSLPHQPPWENHKTWFRRNSSIKATLEIAGSNARAPAIAATGQRQPFDSPELRLAQGRRSAAP